MSTYKSVREIDEILTNGSVVVDDPVAALLLADIKDATEEVATAVALSVMSVNVKQVGGVAVPEEAGPVEPGVQRVTLANDDALVVVIKDKTTLTAAQTLILSDAVTGGLMATNLEAVKNVAVTTGSGPVEAGSIRMTIANDDVLTLAIKNSVDKLDATVLNERVRVDQTAINGVAPTVGIGNVDTGVQRVVLASNDPSTAAITEAVRVYDAQGVESRRPGETVRVPWNFNGWTSLASDGVQRALCAGVVVTFAQQQQDWARGLYITTTNSSDRSTGGGARLLEVVFTRTGGVREVLEFVPNLPGAGEYNTGFTDVTCVEGFRVLEAQATGAAAGVIYAHLASGDPSGTDSMYALIETGKTRATGCTKEVLLGHTLYLTRLAGSTSSACTIRVQKSERGLAPPLFGTYDNDWIRWVVDGAFDIDLRHMDPVPALTTIAVTCQMLSGGGTVNVAIHGYQLQV